MAASSPPIARGTGSLKIAGLADILDQIMRQSPSLLDLFPACTNGGKKFIRTA